MLNTLITSKTRLKLLLKFFINPDNTGYLRGLAKEFSESTNAVRKELNKLEEAGYLTVLEEEDRKKVFQANQSHPLFKIIQKLVRSSVGLDVLVAQVLNRIGGVTRIVIVEDYAKGIDSGLISVVIEGDDLNSDYIYSLTEKIEDQIQREVQFFITNNYQGSGLVIYDGNDLKDHYTENRIEQYITNE